MTQGSGMNYLHGNLAAALKKFEKAISLDSYTQKFIIWIIIRIPRIIFSRFKPKGVSFSGDRSNGRKSNFPFSLLFKNNGTLGVVSLQMASYLQAGSDCLTLMVRPVSDVGLACDHYGAGQAQPAL